MKSLHEIIPLFLERTELVSPSVIEAIQKLSDRFAIIICTTFKVNSHKPHYAWVCSPIKFV